MKIALLIEAYVDSTFGGDQVLQGLLLIFKLKKSLFWLPISDLLQFTFLPYILFTSGR